MVEIHSIHVFDTSHSLSMKDTVQCVLVAQWCILTDELLHQLCKLGVSNATRCLHKLRSKLIMWPPLILNKVRFNNCKAYFLPKMSSETHFNELFSTYNKK